MPFCAIDFGMMCSFVTHARFANGRPQMTHMKSQFVINRNRSLTSSFFITVIDLMCARLAIILVYHEMRKNAQQGRLGIYPDMTSIVLVSVRRNRNDLNWSCFLGLEGFFCLFVGDNIKFAQVLFGKSHEPRD